MEVSHGLSFGKRRMVGLAGLLVLALGASTVLAQDLGNAAPPVRQAVTSDFVTINVDNGSIVQILNAFSIQTGKSIVVGPEVTSNATIRLNHVKWDDALTMILRPYGYGYYLMGDTVIVSSIDKLPRGSGAQGLVPAEPLLTHVFTLKYHDVSDIEELIKGQLSPAGKLGKLIVRGQSWKGEYGLGAKSGGGGTASESMGRLLRISEDKDLVKGQIFAVMDTRDVISNVTALVEAVDKIPVQVAIEAKFIEIRANYLRDIGVEFGTGANGATTPGVTPLNSTEAGQLYGAGAQSINGTVTPAAFQSQSTLSGTRPFDSGITLAFQKLTGVQFQMLLHLLQEDSSFNVLSSPQILTVNNQDATIIVGTKFPIINSQTTPNSGTGPTISTSLEYYENIGIQLKVLPQICDGNYINLTVHPSVRELVSLQSGIVGTGQQSGSGGANVSLTDYPVLSTREVETQVLMASGQTIVIGGLLKDSTTTTMLKTPFLGDIPLLGMLFRRETHSTEKIELLVFLTATIRPVFESDARQQEVQGIVRKMTQTIADTVPEQALTKSEKIPEKALTPEVIQTGEYPVEPEAIPVTPTNTLVEVVSP